MDRRPVASSSIRSAGYDPATAVLELEYEGGAVYRYFPVPGRVYAALMRAGSKGRYVNARIKPRYSFERVE